MTDTNLSLSNPLAEQRHLRHLDILNPRQVATPITLIGAGGIGSHVGLVLAKLGLSFEVYDDDQVELHNLSNQLYPSEELGGEKVWALKRLCEAQGDGEVFVHAIPFTAQPLEGIVISGVDSLDARRQIWQRVRLEREYVEFYVDARMGGEVITIFAVDPLDDELVAEYEKTIAGNVRADPDPCTARAIAYNLFVCAGWVGKLMQAHLRGLPHPNEIYVDLANFQHVAGHWKLGQRPVRAVA